VPSATRDACRRPSPGASDDVVSNIAPSPRRASTDDVVVGRRSSRKQSNDEQ
jgi:hypothetical protein